MVTASRFSPVSDFPPQDLRSFLEFCAGDWLSVRSSFDLDDAVPTPADEAVEPWHQALRGEMGVAFLAPDQDGEPGGLRVTPPAAAGGVSDALELSFEAAGGFQRRSGTDGREISGTWRFWPDGSLELTQADERGEVRERIWFTKPNLRLRSSIEQRHDGRPARASFSSEIRRVGRTTPAPANGQAGGG